MLMVQIGADGILCTENTTLQPFYEENWTVSFDELHFPVILNGSITVIKYTDEANTHLMYVICSSLCCIISKKSVFHLPVSEIERNV